MSTNVSLRERKKRETQRRILETALELFETQGVEASTVDAIAEAANVSRGTFFNYFPTKESLLNAIATEELQDLQRRGIGADDTSATARIYALMRALMTDSLAFLHVTRYILLDAMLHPMQAGSPSVHLDALLKPLVQQAQTQGEIRTDLDPAAVTGALVGVYLGTFFRLISADTVVDQTVITAVEATIRLLFEGIAGPNNSPDTHVTEN